MSDKFYKKAASKSIQAGKIPFPLTSTLIDLFKILVTEKEAEFLGIFQKPSLNMAQIKEKCPGMAEQDITDMLETLMNKGVIVGSRSSSGVDVYTLMPPFPGLVEFTLMKGEKTERERKLASLFEQMFSELTAGTQKNYEHIITQLKDYPVPARTVPVEEFITIPVEKHGEIPIGESLEPKEIVLLPQQATSIIDEYDTIALTHCYCRQEKDLVGSPCKRTSARENCLMFGKSAASAIKHGFARSCTKEDAKKIIKDAEKDGLVHKIFHTKMDFGKAVEGICSCCPDCCGIFQLYYRGALPLHTFTWYLPKVSVDDCTGCETCIAMCPMEAIELADGKARITAEKCIGCGLCASHCPSEAITLERVGPRDVFVPPRKVGASQSP